MEITSVKITIPEIKSGKLLAFADVTVNDCLAIHGIRILEGDSRRFIAFPNTRRSNKENTGFIYSDTVHPLNQETRDIFEKEILTEYEKMPK